MDGTINGIVSPNPFNDVTLLKSYEIPKGTAIQVSDISGRIVQSEIFQGGENFSLGQSLPSGVYILRIEALDQVYTEKLIKQ